MFDLEHLFEHPAESPSLLVAEIGINHEGDLNQAHQLVDLSAESGADAVKFQIFKTKEFIHPSQKEAFALFQRFELPYSAFDELREHATERNLVFFATPLDMHSLFYLADKKDPLVKIASSDLQTFPLIQKSAELFPFVIISTGMSEESELFEPLSLFSPNQIALLYCVSLYPTKAEQIQLHTLARWVSQFNFPVGFSDHTKGIALSLAATTLGAKIIERHFTMDPSLAGADHAISLGPDEFSRLHRGIREIEASLNNSEKDKKISPEEMKIRKAAYRGLFTAKEIQKGQNLSDSDLLFLRPGDGISKEVYQQVITQKATKDFRPYEKI